MASLAVIHNTTVVVGITAAAGTIAVNKAVKLVLGLDQQVSNSNLVTNTALAPICLACQ